MSWIKSLKNSPLVKLSVIFFISLLLLIPTGMIKDLIWERENTKNTAISEVSNKWGKEQQLIGPIISVPYYKYLKQLDNNNISRTVKVMDYLHFLPEELNVKGNIDPNKRKRGIYEIVVYSSALEVSGSFQKPDFSKFDIAEENIILNKALLSYGIADLHGIEEQVAINWNDRELGFNPGPGERGVFDEGIHLNLDLSDSSESKFDFDFKVQLKGSQKLYFAPVGKNTNITLNSSWTNPSFNGAFLPDSHVVNQQGFEANWTVLNLNRNYPQSWAGSDYRINSSSFGVDLILPVDNYQKTYRSIKYAILFIGLTFLSFFFIEILNKRFIHPIQYILVGLALVIFYTLLLSFSEHISFNYAFISAAVATLGLICMYVRAILKSLPLTLMLGGILGILYTFIFVIIQLQDYALLIGSLGMFLVLALVMYFSRKIDWYNIKMDKE